MFFLHILILYHLLEEVIFTLYYLYTTTSGYKVEQQGYKSCMGLLKLADKYTPERLENACKRALEYTPRPSLKNIQAILASGQDKAIPEQSAATASSSRCGFTRGAAYYGRGNK